MKKNRTLRVSALLLALTLITTCFVGGTFAKYTTSASDDVTARVANWGFERTNTISLDNLFSATYLQQGRTDANSVAAANGTDLLVAPGTTGSVQFGFAYDRSAGTAPEVAYTFTVDTTGSEIGTNLDNELVWSLDDSVVGDFDALLDAIKNLSGEADGSKEYAPNALPAAFGVDNTLHTISWTWAYSENADGDTADTSLGNANTLETVKLQIAITAEQID